MDAFCKLYVPHNISIFKAHISYVYPVIVLQMFIAVINENFNVAEESKKGQQATDYWATHQPQTGHVTWIRRLNPYRWVKAAPVSVRVEALPSNLILPMQKSLVQDYNMTGQDGRPVRVRATCLTFYST